MLVMGVLCCPDALTAKVMVLYGVLQDGGVSANEFIAASDKDFPPTFELLCKLSTVALFEWVNEIDNFESPFSDNHEKLVDCIDDFRDDVFLEYIFGNESELGYEAFNAKCMEKGANYIFDMTQMRAKVFEQAGVAYRL